ncbi:LacI family DNA-binding transcriptional regulator [Paenibacillus sp. SYP-B4298]|uniref:LacI family DNA-binding transcriptional regulator n=1 Tax=Paenibacillus sp. SYP-B4298 TaxID=2996034 RepID=UPI0022DDCA16|nr:LacI family DNA-binding transcriptional regulator [Paenibacillus sp. SYP-B4298]
MAKWTMKEIAKLANVSQATVSRVINGNKGVNEEAARRVQEVIQSVGFVPNKAAQTLKHNQSNIIGLSVTETYNPYFIEIIDTLELEARKNGYSILLHNAKHNPITEWDNIQNFIARQVDGIIIVPTGDYNLQRISKLPVPVVVMTQNREMFDSIGLDHMKAGKIAGETFIYAGHQRFGFIGTTPDDKFLGYKSALYENGFEFDPANYIQLEESSNTNFLMRRDIDAYLNRVGSFDFTCVFTANDVMALEFIKAAQERQIRIPEDISVIGFDDTYLAKMMEISSIHQPIEDMVKMTIEIMLNRIDHEASPGTEKVQIKLDPALIERRTSNRKKASGRA